MPEVDFQTLRGSVRIPLGKSILLGYTTSPKLKDGKVCCLIVEVSASQSAPAAEEHKKPGKL